MVSFSLRSVLLSASLISLATLSTAAPGLDACGRLPNLGAGLITYTDVAACYNAIPFDGGAASKTLKSLYTLFNNYYIFRDSALTPNLPPPFTSAAVDIIAELTTVSNKRYLNDFSFHQDVERVVNLLQDAHAVYD
ncbi:hypothetical protein BGZ76_009605, partial [Entomortierella beljakovae]